MERDLLSNKFLRVEKEFLSKIDSDDYVALGDVVRIFSGYHRWPTEEDYLNTLELIKYLLNKYGRRLKYYIGPGIRVIDKSPEELLDWLKEIWYKGEYYSEKMHHSIWFDLEQEEQG